MAVKPLTQFAFEFTGVNRRAVSRAVIYRIGREYVRTGKAPRGVKVKVQVWKKGASLSKGRLKFGCPGVVKQYAEPHTTMVDLDTPDVPRLLHAWWVARVLGIRPLYIRIDRTRRGWHVVTVWNTRFKPLEIVALQAILGSDPRREAFNLIRVRSGKGGNRRWNLLFESKIT